MHPEALLSAREAVAKEHGARVQDFPEALLPLLASGFRASEKKENSSARGRGSQSSAWKANVLMVEGPSPEYLPLGKGQARQLR